MIHAHGNKEVGLMSPKNYSKMYNSDTKVDDVAATPAKIMEENTTPVEEPAKEKVTEPKKETKKKASTDTEKKKVKDGVVTGDLNLNVRKEPNGEIIGFVSPGTKVVIKEDLGDWYKISAPIDGFVMKKFIEA